ncbi:MAG: diacylglycerol kinase [Rhodopirellula sp.]|nr:diacylglycerol kinase [Rhodopirellula sp.]|tara:strand:- start:12410 stop:12901 length:492 start_codon:yes stop_codon:yes gene_type:complete
MTVSIIVAMAENGVIGRDMDLPWHISADLKRFKALTMGHHIVMGRKTFESIGRLLPGRTTVIVTRQPDYQVDGAVIVNSLGAAQAAATDDSELFIIGGGQIYEIALPLADRLHVTRVHTEVDGDTSFPAIDWDQWELVSAERHGADEKNDYDFTFESYRRMPN